MKFSFKARIRSFRFAFDGIKTLLREEHNSRIHLFVTAGVLFAGLILRINLREWALISIVTGLVFLTELINSAVEAIADELDPRTNPSIKKIKDYTAASVLIAAITSVIVGGLVFIPALLRILT